MILINCILILFYTLVFGTYKFMGVYLKSLVLLGNSIVTTVILTKLEFKILCSWCIVIIMRQINCYYV